MFVARRRELWPFVALFSLLLCYFVTTYGYCPGLKLSLEGQVERVIVNGRVIDWQDGRLVQSIMGGDQNTLLKSKEDAIVFRDDIISYEIELRGEVAEDEVEIFLDNTIATVKQKVHKRRKVTIFSGEGYRENCAVSLTAVGLKDVGGTLHRTEISPDGDKIITLSSGMIAGAQQRKFHWELFSAQIITAGARALQKALKTMTPYDGLFGGRFVYWNSLFSLCALCGVFMLYKWLRFTKLASSQRGDS